VDGEPTRQRALQPDRLDRLGVAGRPQGRAGGTRPVAAVAQHLQAGLLTGQQLQAGRPVRGVGGGQRALGHQPRLGLGGEVALGAVAPLGVGVAGMAGLRIDD
jgi:hypothetical protein